MSVYAITYDEAGRRNIVDARECGPEGKGKKFYCPGKCRGGECLAPLELRIGTKVENYFAVTSGASHIHGCPNDESGRTLTTKVLDREGRECTPKRLYEMLLEKRSGTQSDGGGKGGEEPGEEPVEEKPEEDDLLPDEDSVLIKRAPRNLKEIVCSLQELEPDDIYAGTAVEDLLCNSENVAKFKKSGFPNDGLMIVAAWRYKTPKGYRVTGNNYTLMMDGAFEFGQYISFEATDKALEIIRNAVKKRVYIINRWKREEKFKKVFRGSEIVSEHMVYVME